MTGTPLRGTAAVTIVVLTAAAYALVAWAALQLAVAPGFATPLFPSAGIALAAGLTYGRLGLTGTLLGSLVVNLVMGRSLGTLSLDTTWVPLIVATGAALQAGCGAFLVRHALPQPLLLTEPRDLARFFVLGAPVACVVSASIGTATLTLAGTVPDELILTNWWTWWAGDTLGVLIGAPTALTLIGQPAADWRRRRWTVGLPLVLATLFLAAATRWSADAHEQRLRAAFERDAWHLASAVEAGLQAPLDALQGVHSVLASHPEASAALLRHAAAPWLGPTAFIQAIGWSARVPRDQLPTFETQARAEGPADYRVFDRPGLAEAAADRNVVVVRFIEPLAGNQGALGVNALSIPAARQAILRAVESGGAVATAGFRLTQSNTDETGVVLYKAVSDGPGDWRGIAFVTLRVDAMIGGLLKSMPRHLNWCLMDRDPGANRQRLAGPAGCEDRADSLYAYEHRLALAERELSLTVVARESDLPGAADSQHWLFIVTGLMATAVLGALLLVVSGRQRRFETAVRERTSELEEAGRALRRGEERLRNLLDHLPVGVFQADTDGRLRDCNPHLATLLGLPPSGDVGRFNIVALAHTDDRDACRSLLRKLGEPDAPDQRAQLRLRGASDADLSVQMSLSRLRSSEEGRPQVIGVVEDITEHMALESLERARDKAETANRAKSEFVGRMSHELRTPLNAMLGFSQLLDVDGRPPLAPHQRDWARQIQTAGWHLLAMINDTLDLSMIEAGALRLVPVPLEVSEVLASTLALLADTARQRQLRIDAPVVGPGAEFVTGDPTRVKQVVTNLLSNAIKYNRVGGRVTVEARRLDPETVEIAVGDTGPGMDATQLEHLFEPFNRLGQSASGVEGTGIGLVISRRLAELMGGQLVARSVVGDGTVFLLRLPVAGRRVAAAATVPAEVSEARYPARRVHYVEDNPANVELVRGMLARRPQITLSVSTLGREALVEILRSKPDAVLLDMHLPDMDGLEVLRRLGAGEGTASVPVLVISADATRDRIELAKAAGAAAYLTKPLVLHDLLGTLDKILGSAR